MNIIQNETFDEERALYGICDSLIVSCRFEGPADGESALKESRNNTVKDCIFALRYPLWHTKGGLLCRCTLAEGCRAPLWYTEDLQVQDCTFRGVKALRECARVSLSGCTIDSAEFGWLCRNLTLLDCALSSEYAFFGTKGLTIKEFTMQGKYSFQYIEDAEIRDAVLHTKDAFWHSRRVTVYDSEIHGEYLGWYAEDLSLVRCKIFGTQPLCYVKNLTLIDCEMIGCDLSFENSTVQASITGSIDSIKSPAAGYITADRIGQIISEKAPTDGRACKICVQGKELIY